MSRLSSVFFATMALASLGHSAVMWDEAVNGDLSGDRFNPTQLNVTTGSNFLMATTGDSELDFYTFNVASGQQLTEIYVRSYSAQDIMFIGVTTGSFFAADPLDTDITDLLGWAHFGPDHLNLDILPTMGTGEFGAQGFTPPLGAGDYSFWMNQWGDPTNYTLEFVVAPVPEPATWSILGLGVAALMRRRRKA